MALRSSVIDIPFSIPDQTQPKHTGPIGRIERLINAEVTRYIPPSPGVQARNEIDQRKGFESLSSQARNVLTGDDIAAAWDNPDLLATLGDRLISVASHRPRVWNGSAWSYYAASRVEANRLSQQIIHTGNHTIQAPDSARLDGVTCNVWCEFNPATTSFDSWIGFYADDGTVITAPRVLFTADQDHPGLCRVVSDGTVFWVICLGEPLTQTLRVSVYNARGQSLSEIVVDRSWDTAPGYWDICAQNTAISGIPYTAILAQPKTVGAGAEVFVHLDYLSWDGFTVGLAPVDYDTGGQACHCRGPVAWLRNARTDTGGQAYYYLATVGPDAATGHVWAYEFNSGVRTTEYDVVDVNSIPDSITGYVDNGRTCHIAISLLSSVDISTGGPLNDPALRHIQIWNAPASSSAVLYKEATSLIAQTRAFQLGDEHFLGAYYQSGSGLLREPPAPIPVTIDPDDFFLGQPHQPLVVHPNDIAFGGLVTYTATSAVFRITQAIATITHNAGDSANAATQVWTFLNAAFDINSVQGSILNITGSAIPDNNHSFRILAWVSNTSVVTEPISLSGTPMTSENLAGVTASVTKCTMLFWADALQGGQTQPFDEATVQYYQGQSMAITGSAAGNNVTFTTKRIFLHAENQAIKANGAAPGFYTGTIIISDFIAGNVAAGGVGTTTGATFTPSGQDLVRLTNNLIDSSSVGQNLAVSGAAKAPNNASFAIVAAASSGPYSIIQVSPGMVMEIFDGTEHISVDLAIPGNAFMFHLENVDFDDTYRGALITLSGGRSMNNGSYLIVQLVDAHTVITTPATGLSGQVNQELDQTGSEVVTIQIPTTSQLPTQPCWFLVGFDSLQRIDGQWERGIAYADWRFDGHPSLLTWPNEFVMGLSSVPAGPDGAAMVLPYRAQSFTAGQVFDGQLQTAQQNTVGLKRFLLAVEKGNAIETAGALLLPGPLAAQFSQSGFAEQNVSLAFEQPWLASKGTSSAALALTLGAAYQYDVVAELTDENGDRVFSKPSPVLNVTLQGTENKITIGGRLIWPTNHALIGIAIYRTSIAGGIPTVEHYKVTNDLDVNGAGFTFSTVGDGIGLNTWEYVDEKPDQVILSSEILYTDKGMLPRFPAPAFHRGIGSFKERTWVVGYDNAIWMSGPKTEGDALWFHPAFRIPPKGNDTLQALAILDEYIVMGCAGSLQYIAPATLPDATGRNGLLPVPVALPFPNGCSGQMATIRGGVAYGSTAGGVWTLGRALQNEWLSQPLQDDLNAVVGFAIDAKQRLFVATGGPAMFVFDMVSAIWSRCDTALPVGLVAAWNGNAVYQDDDLVMVQGRGYADVRAGVRRGIAHSAFFAPISFTRSVRGWARLWAMQLLGQYRGPHALSILIAEPEEEGPPPSAFAFNPSATKPYVYEFNPQNEEAASFVLAISAIPTGNNPGRTATWESWTAEVGVEGGIARLPSGSREPSAT